MVGMSVPTEIGYELHRCTNGQKASDSEATRHEKATRDKAETRARKQSLKQNEKERCRMRSRDGQRQLCKRIKRARKRDAKYAEIK